MNEHPVDVMYGRARVTGSDSGGTLNDTIEKLARIPLKFALGHEVELRRLHGRLRLSGGAVLGARRSTSSWPSTSPSPSAWWIPAFHVRPGSEDRFAACYQYVAPAAYRLQDDPEGSRYLERPTFFSGGGGMVGTIDDYHRFAKMLLGKGGTRGNPPARAQDAGVHDQQPPAGQLRPSPPWGSRCSAETPYEGIGFGLGFSVVIDPAAANVLDSPGEFAWGGRREHLLLGGPGRGADRRVHDPTPALIHLPHPQGTQDPGVSSACLRPARTVRQDGPLGPTGELAP